jgi:spoIIIJ-associated protein
MSAYKEFSGKTVEEAIRLAREEFGVGLNDLDFEILTPGSRGVLGMGAEPARIVAAPRAALGGAAPKREAAASVPLPAPRSDDRGDRPRFDRGDRGPRRDDRGPRRDDRPPRRDDRAPVTPTGGDDDRGARSDARPDRPPRRDDRADRADRGPRRDDRGDRGPRRDDRGPRRAAPADLSASEAAEVAAARGSVAAERADLEAAEATVQVAAGETSRLNVVADGDDREALGALIGRKGERLSALQHLVNLMLSKEMGAWTRVLVDVEDYRGRRERQLRELADRAAARVAETGKMLQLEPMPALERRWIHLTLRDHPAVVTQSIGEEPNRRVVLVPRGG